MTEKEKMLAGELYDCGDPELMEIWHMGKNLARDYNLLDSQKAVEKKNILKKLLGGMGENIQITSPFTVDYGCNIYFGNNCEVNMNCTFLDDDRPCDHRKQCMDWRQCCYLARCDHRR